MLKARPQKNQTRKFARSPSLASLFVPFLSRSVDSINTRVPCWPRISFPWPAMIVITINSLVHSADGLQPVVSLKTRGRRLTPQRTDKLLAICTSPRRPATNRPDLELLATGQKYWIVAVRVLLCHLGYSAATTTANWEKQKTRKRNKEGRCLRRKKPPVEL